MASNGMLHSIKRGFTLIELLIVVAIIAILAAIAVPNFLEARMRSKISRTLADMRTVVVAMESYTVDNNVWILDGFDYLRLSDYRDRESGHGFGLTTPISYITTIPFDNFNTNIFENLAPHNNQRRVKNASVFYRSSSNGPGSWLRGGNQCCAWPLDRGDWRQFGIKGFNWMISSAGPDHVPWPQNSVGHYYNYDELYYDPTNGTISVGDICYIDTYGWRGGGVQ